MTLHPEDMRYWAGWFLAFVLWLVCTRRLLVEPIIRAIEKSAR